MAKNPKDGIKQLDMNSSKFFNVETCAFIVLTALPLTQSGMDNIRNSEFGEPYANRCLYSIWNLLDAVVFDQPQDKDLLEILAETLGPTFYVDLSN